MGAVYDKYASRVSAAISLWVNNQAAAVKAGSCYIVFDEALEKALAKASVDVKMAMDTVCDCAVLEARTEED